MDRRSAVLSLGSNMSIHTPTWTDFSERGKFKRQNSTIFNVFYIFFLTARAYLPIQVPRCFEKPCPFFPHHHRTFKKAPASRESRLCLCLLEGLFTLRILFSSALICSGFKVFRPAVSSPPRLCQSPILLSHFPPPPTVGVNLPPAPREE